MKRFYVYDYLIGSPILIDTEKKQFIFYGKNIYGQIYNIKDTEEKDIFKISKQRINGLIKRLNNRNYNSSDGFVVDPYIYNYIMTEEEKTKADREISAKERDFITSGDNITEVLEKTCKWVLKYSQGEKHLETAEGQKSIKILKNHIQEATRSDLFN